MQFYLMFRAIAKFSGLFRRLRALHLFRCLRDNDNLRLAILALQLGALWQAYRIYTNGWRRSPAALEKFDRVV